MARPKVEFFKSGVNIIINFILADMRVFYHPFLLSAAKPILPIMAFKPAFIFSEGEEFSSGKGTAPENWRVSQFREGKRYCFLAVSSVSPGRPMTKHPCTRSLAFLANSLNL